MKKPTPSGEAGYVSVYVALVTSLVLVPLVMFVIDLGSMAYHRTKLKNTADAVAIAAVAESSSWHIPIPTEWVGYVPVNGWVINALHLKNLGPLGGIKPKLQKLAELNQDQIGLSTPVEVKDASVYPLANFLSPIMYVKIPVEADVQLHTPFLAKALGKQKGKPGALKMRAESCAVAWYRIDRWGHKWWSADPETIEATVDDFLGTKNEPQKYYRLVNCINEGSDIVSLAEAVITEHVKLDDKFTSILQSWASRNGGNRDMQKTRKSLEQKGSLDECKADDPCIELNRDSLKGWLKGESGKKKAEDEAEKAREEARAEAARKAKQ